MSDTPKIAPVQGFAAGIPWAMHLRAYDAYCKMYGPQKALIEGWCRGGFGTSELDMFIPGWREELSEVEQLRAELTAALAANEALVRERDALRTALDTIANPRRGLPEEYWTAEQIGNFAREILAI